MDERTGGSPISGNHLKWGGNSKKSGEIMGSTPNMVIVMAKKDG